MSCLSMIKGCFLDVLPRMLSAFEFILIMGNERLIVYGITACDVIVEIIYYYIYHRI